MKSWFDVDRHGLAKLLDRKGKEFALFELVQNAWDERGVTAVDVTLTDSFRGQAMLTVRDDAPDGFKELAHAYTLFAESGKKANPEARGRFNLGEKLFLALCNEAEIVTTTGGVRFDRDGRHRLNQSLNVGSRLSATAKLSHEDVDRIQAAFFRLLPPPGIKTTLNGTELPARLVKHKFTVTLPTELADNEGSLRRTERQCTVEVLEPMHGEVGALYEMGIPVVDTGDRWHYNVSQKVPLTFDRENVPPSYIKAVRVAVLNQMHSLLTADDTNGWAAEAAADKRADPVAVSSYLNTRFGAKRVAYDPSDPEANKRAAAEGYTVVHGGMLSAGAWQNAKSAGAIQPAGQVTPSAKPYAENGTPFSDYTPTEAMLAVENYAKRFALEVLGRSIEVRWVSEVTWRYAATYGPGSLTLNVGTLGKAWFNLPNNREEIDRLLIHEFGHEYSSDHLSSDYYDALCRVGAGLVKAVREGRMP